jgi:hypothetical protein
MPKSISRRKVLGMAASAAAAIPASTWVFAPGKNGTIVKAAAEEGTAWTPRLFTEEQAEAVATLAEAIIPRTDTPGARDARVHEFIDLELSLDETEAPDEFLSGLGWLEERAQTQYASNVATLNEADLQSLLKSVSDEQESHPEENEPGAEFFVDLKDRTIFAYYTSKEARVELGLPRMNAMGKFKGCPHDDNDHTA